MVRSGEYYYNVVWPETRSAVESLFNTIRSKYLKFEDATYFDSVAFVYSVIELRNSILKTEIINQEKDHLVFDSLVEKYAQYSSEFKNRIDDNISKLCNPRHKDFPSILHFISKTVNLSAILNYIKDFFENEISCFGSHVDIEGFAETFYSQMGDNIPNFCMSWMIDKDEDGRYFIFEKVYSDFSFMGDDDDKIINKKYIDAEYVWDYYDSEGFARVLTSDRRWGYISKENGNLYLLPSDVIYANSFKNGFALVQKYNSIYYIDARIKKAFDKEFDSGRQYNNGTATVSDNICNEFRIDVNGDIIEEDKDKYKEALEYRKKHPVLGYFSNSGSFVSEDDIDVLDDDDDDEEDSLPYTRKSWREYDSWDPESEIMDALEHGDPEQFGF